MPVEPRKALPTDVGQEIGEYLHRILCELHGYCFPGVANTSGADWVYPAQLSGGVEREPTQCLIVVGSGDARMQLHLVNKDEATCNHDSTGGPLDCGAQVYIRANRNPVR